MRSYNKTLESNSQRTRRTQHTHMTPLVDIQQMQEKTTTK